MRYTAGCTFVRGTATCVLLIYLWPTVYSWTNVVYNRAMASRKSIVDLLVPGCGNPFDISQCEWMLDALSVRAVQTGLRLDWQSLDDMCRNWLAKRDVMTPLPAHRTAQRRENLPMVYNMFRSSLLQHYAFMSWNQPWAV